MSSRWDLVALLNFLATPVEHAVGMTILNTVIGLLAVAVYPLCCTRTCLCTVHN